MDLLAFTNPPFAFDAPKGVGGTIKGDPADFEVEEIPAYLPSGEGDHLYLWVEKRGMGAEYFLKHLARKLGLPTGEIGSAGLKDRHAVTRQYLSVPAEVEPRLSALEGDEEVRLLKVERHTNKLKPGHLKGNRFKIVVRDTDPAGRSSAEAILERLKTEGIPNYFGTQRFGHDNETAKLGLNMLGLFADINIRPPRAPFMRKLALSAAQSVLFNAVLARRHADGLMRTVLAGDVMGKWPSGGMFNASDMAVEQERFERRETVPMGPMIGKKTFLAREVAAEREEALFREAGLERARLGGFGNLLMGTRRHNLVYADDLGWDWLPDGLELRFALPAGSYATVLLREVMRVEVPAAMAAPEAAAEAEDAAAE